MHREITQAKEGEVVDHINHNTLDNRKINLRVCTHRQNMRNQVKPKNNTSRFKGVNKEKGRWRARILVDKKRLSLGMFENIFDAVFARREAEAVYYGEFSCNF